MSGLVSRRGARAVVLAVASAFTTEVPLPSDVAVRIAQDTSSHADAYNRYAVDFMVAPGTPVLAGFDGLVTFTRGGCPPLTASACGNEVLLQHADGTCAIHAHLATVAVAVGQRVPRGTPLGTVGASGAASSPHLHYDRITCDSRISLPWAIGSETPAPAPAVAPLPEVAPFTPRFLLGRGRLIEVTRISGLRTGSTVNLRCLRGCARPLRLVTQGTRIRVPRGFPLRAETRLELRVSRAGEVARSVRYRFHGLSVVAVNTP